MTSFTDLFWLLLLGGIIGAWMKLTRAREVAAREAQALCQRHGLQLLDQSVGLRGIRLRRFGDGRRLERCYGFEVSGDGQTREAARLWMSQGVVTGFSLPTRDARELESVVATQTSLGGPQESNVVSLADRRQTRH
ncbi:uncharacterized protein DUF3301 [Luteibacter rhizovicinus]|uniref:Uncharacterized protein DUF3301 n=1 Tax=Luteibacter rhizovicinus TaxID=242606 RepID=A0A4R3YU96_9GAMM|nr:DUF3301 domain-containing protein [Luteibacter rhizovicinus]TCV94924.1 uncharacterized protein DUF3301 [Luteibacter rhizovicinus]